MHDFKDDNKWQRGLRDRILVPSFYKPRAVEGRYVLLDDGVVAAKLQKDLAIDTVLQAADGKVVTIEEKITRFHDPPHPNFFLETKSCTNPGHEKDGGMVYGVADWLLYCFVSNPEETQLDCYFIDFPALKEWFWPRVERWHLHRMPDTSNHTEGRLVPISEVRAAVECRRRIAPGRAPWDTADNLT